ncbi:hypothetical protein EW14_0040 [Prochlorococcus sp. MIT 0604]|nr:hypothetical protein EW14_0040 [Prochlorococcus sp. MIT 0604]
MGLMKKLLFGILFLSFLCPVNSETKDKKEYGKYDFYSKCLDDALPKKMNNALVWECSTKASKKIDSLIQKQISSRGDCDKEGFESHACQLKRSQTAFKTYYQTECTWNKYGPHYEYCEMMLKKSRLEWLDKTL